MDKSTPYHLPHKQQAHDAYAASVRNSVADKRVQKWMNRAMGSESKT